MPDYHLLLLPVTYTLATLLGNIFSVEIISMLFFSTFIECDQLALFSFHRLLV